MRLAVDIGGTFTDFVLKDAHGRIHIAKTLSTPHDPIAAITEGARLLNAQGFQLVHGTTIVTNSILERKGARTLLITNQGFEDTLAIGRQTRRALYALHPEQPRPWLAREDIVGVQARRDAEGRRVADFAAGELEALAERARDYEAAAVCLLFSFRNPEDERAIASALPVWTSCSHEVAPTAGEYERMATTFLNAFTGLRARAYLQALTARLAPKATWIMHSAGGLIPVEEAAERPIALALSGPAGGLVAAEWLGGRLGEAQLFTFDMGGTSTDVAAIEKRAELAPAGEIAGMPIALPMLAIHTIGAGGGSIAWVDEAGMPQVGPRSAGADPGPACYGHGGEDPTVTDANLVLGRLPPGVRLGGRMALDADAAKKALARFGAPLGLAPERAAAAIVQLVEEAMAGALRVVSIERGRDPRCGALVCFGGAGGLHAAHLAEHLEIPRVVFPVAAGAFSALGMLACPPRIELAKTLAVRLDAEDARTRIGEAFAALKQEAKRRLATATRFSLRLRLRYLGQGDALAIPWENDPDAALRAFADAHQRAFGHVLSRPVEAVAAQLTAEAPHKALQLPELAPAEGPPQVLAHARELAAGEGPVIARASLAPGHELAGPAWVVEDTATFFLPPGWALQVHPEGHLIAERVRWTR